MQAAGAKAFCNRKSVPSNSAKRGRSDDVDGCKAAALNQQPIRSAGQLPGQKRMHYVPPGPSPFVGLSDDLTVAPGDEGLAPAALVGRRPAGGARGGTLPAPPCRAHRQPASRAWRRRGAERGASPRAAERGAARRGRGCCGRLARARAVSARCGMHVHTRTRAHTLSRKQSHTHSHTHALTHAIPRPRYASASPAACAYSGCRCSHSRMADLMVRFGVSPGVGSGRFVMGDVLWLAIHPAMASRS